MVTSYRNTLGLNCKNDCKVALKKYCQLVEAVKFGSLQLLYLNAQIETMPKHIYLFILLFLCSYATAQSNKTDSTVILVKRLASKTLNHQSRYAILVQLGKLYINQQHYEKALQSLLRAQQIDQRYNLHEKKHFRPFADLFFLLEAYEMSIIYEKKISASEKGLNFYFSASNLGRNYLTIQNFERGIYYYNQQLRCAREMGDSLGVSMALQNKGLAYQSCDQYEEADDCFRSALRSCQSGAKSRYFEEERANIIKSIKVDQGTNNYDLGNYAAAKELLEAEISENDYTVFDKNRSTLFKTYLKLGDLDKASQYLSWLERKCDFSSITDKLRLIDLKIRLAIQQQNTDGLEELNEQRWQLFRKYYRTVFIQKNKVSKVLTFFLTEEANAAVKQELEHQKVLKVRLDLEKKQKNWITIGSIILFILIGSSIYILWQVYKVRQRNIKLEKTQLELDNLQKELTIKSQEENLIEFALDFDRNKQFDEQIAKKLTALIELPAETISRELKTFIAEFKQLTTINQKAEVFVANSAEFLAKFKYALLKVHPNLKKSEIQLCQYVRLELSNKEIASIKNISIESVKNAKNRLKHKLGLSGEDNLNTYLVQLFILRENEKTGV
jgi:DNA-binding CsgD family transcriptional regulator